MALESQTEAIAAIQTLVESQWTVLTDDTAERKTFTLVNTLPFVKARAHSWPLNTTGITSASFDLSTGVLATAGEQITALATMVIRGQHARYSIAREALFQTDGSPQYAVNLKTTRATQAVRDLLIGIEAGLWSDGTGNSNKDIVGMNLAVDSTGTYSGIDRSTYTNFASVETAHTTVWTASQTDATLRTLRTSPKNTQPDVAATTPATWDQIWQTLKSNNPNQSVNTDTSFGGCSAIVYSGVPIVAAADCTSGHIYWLRLEDFHIGEVRGVEVTELGVTADIIDAYVAWSGGLVCKHSGRQGKDVIS